MPTRRRSKVLAGLGRLFAMAVAGFIGAAIFWFLFARSPDPHEPTFPVSSTAPPAIPAGMPAGTLAPLVRVAAPAVVNVAVLQASPLEQNPLLQDPFFRRFFAGGDDVVAPRLAAGSGVIVDAQRGLIVTNDHVVRNARAIQVTLNDRREFDAKLLFADPRTDIAVLQIKARGLKQLTLGDSDKLSVGDYVVAIGNPFQIGQTVTAGIVSALGAPSPAIPSGYVQTDAPINPGNSGGPLISMQGQVIGINTAIVGPSGGNVGIGIAVPSNVARLAIERLTR